MNIFAIEGNEETGEIDWWKSGESLDNLRTVKMILESTQLLSTALHLNGMQGCYKLTHKNHPSTKWVAESYANWHNLYIHAGGLIHEYEGRFNKIHKCKSLIVNMADIAFNNRHKFPSQKPTPLKLAMPDEFKSDNPVKSYRSYYLTKENMRYPKDRVPSWFRERRKLPFIEI